MTWLRPFNASNAPVKTSTIANQISGIDGSLLTGITKAQVGLSNVQNVDTTNASNINSGQLANAQTTATASNVANAIVARDAFGSFSATTVTAALNGNSTTATTSNNLANGVLGSVPYQSAANTTVLLNPNTSTNLQVFTQTGTGSVGTIPVWITAQAANAASTIMSRDASSNTAINSITQNWNTTASSASPVTLTVTSAPYQNVTGSIAQTFYLPNATTLYQYQSYIIQNQSSASITILAFDQVTSIAIIQPSNQSRITVTNISTSNGTWNADQLLMPATPSTSVTTITNMLAQTGLRAGAITIVTADTSPSNNGAWLLNSLPASSLGNWVYLTQLSNNLTGGAAGSIPYQTASDVTAMLAAGTGVLVGGSTPTYSTAPTLTGTNFSGIPNSATTATSADTASAIVARDASGNFSAGNITAPNLYGNAHGLDAYNTTQTYSAGNLITGDGTNGVLSAIYICNTNGTTGAYTAANWDLMAFVSNASATPAKTVSLGVGAGTAGGDSVYVGYFAGHASTSSNLSNTGVGYQSLLVVNTGQANTCLGQNSGKSFTSGSLNTMIGYNCGQSLSANVNDCTYLGAYAGNQGSDSTTSNQIIISDGAAIIGIRIPTGGAALAANLFLATPNGATGAASPRAIVNADLPSGVFFQQGRLTDTTGTPNGGNSLVGSTTLYFTPSYQGNTITLYNTTSNTWVTQTFAEVSTTMAITAGNYDIYITSASSTTVTMSTVAWTNDTTPPTRGSQNGRLTKNGAANSLLVGIVRTNGARTYSWVGTRWIINFYNAINLPLLAEITNIVSYGYTPGTANVITAVNGNVADGQGRFSALFDTAAIGQGIVLNNTQVVTSVTGSAAGDIYYTGIGIDSTSANVSYGAAEVTIALTIGTANTLPETTTCTYTSSGLVGYHYFQRTESGNDTGMTVTLAAANATFGQGGLMTGSILG